MGLFSGFLLKTLVLAGRQQEWTTMIRLGVMVLSEVFYRPSQLLNLLTTKET